MAGNQRHVRRTQAILEKCIALTDKAVAMKKEQSSAQRALDEDTGYSPPRSTASSGTA
jgi:hypothetical protein